MIADMPPLAKRLLSPEEYLTIERAAPTKSEYWNGEMFSMAGAREAHNLLVLSAGSLLWQQLRGAECRAYVNDMRVHTPSGLYTYPDVVVACGARQFKDATKDTLLNPVLIGEVLSPSTEAYDRGEKFKMYRSLESLREYLLISSQRMAAELFSFQRGGSWILTEASKPEDEIVLVSCNCRLRLADLYEGVEFAA
jgi:Uma2 family endonuclease